MFHHAARRASTYAAAGGRSIPRARPPLAAATRACAGHARQLATEREPRVVVQSKAPAAPVAPRRRLRDEIKEYEARLRSGSSASVDPAVIEPADAVTFPRIKTTSLSTKRVVIHDKAAKAAVTLVLLAFRSFADEQLESWRSPFLARLKGQSVQVYDITINESFAARALSGFIQRLQRGRTDPAVHDFNVAFNDRAEEPLEVMLPSGNRMFGYALLLDRDARVRFRASGMASPDALDAFLAAAEHLLAEDEKRSESMNAQTKAGQ